MEGSIGIAASDCEPGTVIVTVTSSDGATIVYPLKGQELEQFALAFGVACATAFVDMALTELNAREPEHRT